MRKLADRPPWGTVKPAAVIVAFLLVTAHLRVPVHLIAGYWLAVPVPVLAAVVLVSAAAALSWPLLLMARCHGLGVVPSARWAIA